MLRDAELFFFWLLISFQLSETFYVPAVPPEEFSRGQKIGVTAVKMTSSRTQLPLEYYSLQFCLPKNGTLVSKPLYFGEGLTRHLSVDTPYEVQMAENSTCNILCLTNWTKAESQVVAERVKHDYLMQLLVDNLPALRSVVDKDNPEEVTFEYGYRLGRMNESHALINNHLNFLLSYRKTKNDKYQVVGFIVEPESIDQSDMNINGDMCEFSVLRKPKMVTKF